MCSKKMLFLAKNHKLLKMSIFYFSIVLIPVNPEHIFAGSKKAYDEKCLF